jgi:hypothetical protein
MEGACPSRIPSCGGQGPQAGPVVRQGRKGERAQCRSEEGKPWDNSDVPIVLQEAVSFLSAWADVTKIWLRLVHLLCSRCMGVLPVQWIS